MTQTTTPDVCIFLLQLGGPKDLNGIEPFLTNLFEDVLPLPRFLRRPLAKFIAKRRTPEVMPLYQEIGGGSPLLPNTIAQQEALEKSLAAQGVKARVYICMRYAPPRSAEAIAAARAACPDVPWMVLPLYPQYSYATTRSSLDELKELLTPKERARIQVVCAYHQHPEYLKAVAEGIDGTLSKLTADQRARVHLVFSAHGLPMKLVREGDPYPQHIQATVDGVLALLSDPPTYTLSYQSRVGPVKWLEPPTLGTLQKLGAEGHKEIVVVPIAFVSEHIETLHELDIQLRETAEKAGVTTYLRVPTVSTQPGYINTLAQLALERLKAPRTCCGSLPNCEFKAASAAA